MHTTVAIDAKLCLKTSNTHEKPCADVITLDRRAIIPLFIEMLDVDVGVLSAKGITEIIHL